MTNTRQLGNDHSGTFPRGFINHQTNVDNAQMIETIARETNGNIAIEKRRQTVAYAPDPMDVRGIPAVGRNCPGRINGTRPDAILDR